MITFRYLPLRSPLAWGAVAACLLLSACTTTSYSYLPPETESGRLCAATCNTGLQTCIVGMHQATAAERQNCRMMAMLRESECLATAKDDAQRQSCLNSSSCFTHDTTDKCKATYNQCYADCGGQVIATEQPLFH